MPLDDLANPRIKPCPRLCCSAVGHRTLRTHELAILSLEVPRPGRLGEALGAIMGGRLESIWVKRARRGPMDEAVRVELQAGLGIVGNADQGGWRQVTLLATATGDEVVEAMAIPLDASLRRANLLVSGVRLAHTRGVVLRIGECRLRIRGETRPCALMDEAAPGLQAALAPGWRGGVFAQALDDGAITVGDPIEWA